MSNVIVVIIGIWGTISSIFLGYISYVNSMKNHNHKKREKDGSTKTHIDHIKSRVDEMIMEQREINKNISSLSERVTRVEENTILIKELLKKINSNDYKFFSIQNNSENIKENLDSKSTIYWRLNNELK